MQKKASMLMAVIALLHTLPVQASLVGFYPKVGGIYVPQAKKKIEDWGAILTPIGYQVNRNWIVEVEYTLAQKENALSHSVAFVNKTVAPLAHNINVYWQTGAAVRMRKNTKIPFAGVGGTYYRRQRLLIDLAYRCYWVPEDKSLNPREERTGLYHSVMLGVGYYIA